MYAADLQIVGQQVSSAVNCYAQIVFSADLEKKKKCEIYVYTSNRLNIETYVMIA